MRLFNFNFGENVVTFSTKRAQLRTVLAFDQNAYGAIRQFQQLQDLRAANEELIAANTALREANAQGVGDPELINRGLQAELDAMRTMRATDAAETGAVIEALGPLLAEAADGEARE